MRNRSVFHTVLPILMLLPALATAGMVALEDEALSEFTGEGIALVLEDFRFQMRNTGYIEQIGSPAAAGFQRADMRWYGLTLSGAVAADGLGWTAEACGHLLCPIANKGALIAPFDNPYMLRVFDKTGWDFQNVSVTKTVLEVIGPTMSDAYRWAFWGEAEVGKTTTGNSGLLRSQVMIVGKPTTTDNKGAVLRILQNQDNNDRSLGFNWFSRLSGDFRFSLSQTTSGSDTLGAVPLFENGTAANAPGLKFRNVNAYVPLGQLFYQSLIFDDTATGTTAGNGNFVIELTRLPNQGNAYADFYSYSTCTDARYTGVNCGYQRQATAARPARYFETHGYSRWGDWYPGNGANCGAAGTVCNTFDNTADGIIFGKALPAGTFTATATRPDTAANLDNAPPVPILTQTRTGLSSVNLGDSRIEGMLIQRLKITSLGAGP